MNKLRYAITILAVFLLAACYEVNEEIVINGNGTGTYETRMDMSGMVEMMRMMAGEEELTKNGLDRPIDTTISMQSVLESNAQATAEQKRLYNDGTLDLEMDIQENILKADINFPFKSYDDLAVLMSGSGTGGLSEVFKTVFAGGNDKKRGSEEGNDGQTATDVDVNAGANNTGADDGAPPKENGLEEINQVFDVKVTRNSITRTLNRARYDELMSKPELVQAKQMAGAGMEIQYTTTIRFPRPVKQCDNALIKFQDDKKTAVFKYNLMEMLDTPEKFSYSIVY